MILSERNVYIAAHVTEEVKQRIADKSAQTGKSISLLVSEAIEESLKENERGQESITAEACGNENQVDLVP